MESSSLLFILFLTLITIIILVLRLLGNNITSAGNKHHLPLPPPPGPWRLPIIGNIHQLISNLPHRRLRHLAHKYGPDVMQLQLGQLHHIIISSAEAARQVMKTHDVIFASRPTFLGADIVVYAGKDLAFTPYTDYYRKLHRVRSFRSVREGEVWGMVENLYRSADKEEEVELGKALFGLTMRVTNRTAFGKVRGKVDEEEFYKLMEKIADVMGGLKISDLFPSLKWLPVMNGYKGQLMEIHRQVDGMLDYIISVYKERRTRSTDNKDDDDDLVDVLLNLEESGHLGFTLTLDHVKAVTLEIFLAGVETTAISMDWTMAELMRNPRVMQKVQKEKRTVDEESIHELKYLELVIQESLRLHPSLPLLLPRENHERAEIMGYEIQPKTKVIINSWAIGRDPRYWVEPEKFYPERFLIEEATNKNYKGTDNFEYIPFGAGRRMCPGISYASAIMKLTLANMLFHFDWKLQVGLNPENLDMTERFGASVRRDGILSLIPVAYHSL
ncbi:Premnaspirodiene oxygenase [Linum perenne]